MIGEFKVGDEVYVIDTIYDKQIVEKCTVVYVIDSFHEECLVKGIDVDTHKIVSNRYGGHIFKNIKDAKKSIQLYREYAISDLKEKINKIKELMKEDIIVIKERGDSYKLY